MILGLDIGYGYTKVYTTKDGQPLKTVFPTLVSKFIPEKSGGFGSETSPIKIGDSVYLVGDDVSNTMVGLSGYRVGSDFVGKPEYFALIGHVLDRVNVPVETLVLGLPPELYETDRVTILKRMLLATEFRNANGDLIPTPLKVEYIPQGAGIFFSHVSNNGNHIDSSKSVVVIDVGYYTVDMVLFSKGKYIKESGKSYPKGIRFVLEKIKSRYAKKYGSFIGDNIAETILKEGKFRHFGQEYRLDITDILNDFYKQQLWGVVSEYAMITKNAKHSVDKVVIGGAGISNVGRISDATVVDDPQFANAKGYYEYGKAITVTG